jgi:hypothetical protein
LQYQTIPGSKGCKTYFPDVITSTLVSVRVHSHTLEKRNYIICHLASCPVFSAAICFPFPSLFTQHGVNTKYMNHLHQVAEISGSMPDDDGWQNSEI